LTGRTGANPPKSKKQKRGKEKRKQAESAPGQRANARNEKRRRR